VRVVLDTNVVVSGLLWGGTSERLIELAGEGSLECLTSEALLAELTGIRLACTAQSCVGQMDRTPSSRRSGNS